MLSLRRLLPSAMLYLESVLLCDMGGVLALGRPSFRLIRYQGEEEKRR